MMLTGTVTSEDNQYNCLSAEGDTYEEARANLETLLADGQKLIVIRTDSY
ncbi:hypothetical protein [Arthrobacter sp. W4I7]|nr:hypothetical protein [Arthrobacter sp. W4I7]MDQ0692538.1 hypothetical protein [Arthrobacter sp. W4I7]